MWLPEAMSIGVDYSIFWKLNPKKLEAFAWLSGMYFGEMASSLLSKKHRYPKAPHPLEPPTEQQRFERAKNKMLSWANKVNANIAAREQIANEKEV